MSGWGNPNMVSTTPMSVGIPMCGRSSPIRLRPPVSSGGVQTRRRRHRDPPSVCQAHPYGSVGGPRTALSAPLPRGDRDGPVCLGCQLMELRLDGKTALITGASRGIGQAMALAFAAAGASVMLSSRKADALAEATSVIDGAKGDRAGEVAWQVANAGDPEQASACVAATVERFGTLDILVNNAATNPY